MGRFRVDIQAVKETNDWTVTEAENEDDAVEIAVGNFIEAKGPDWNIELIRCEHHK